ncbi:hypothetical protein CHUAL_013295 [Chamberlinius hualienensis]
MSSKDLLCVDYNEKSSVSAMDSTHISNSASDCTLGNGPEYKITLVGDSQSGKTAMIHCFLNDKFLEKYTPTGFQRYSSTCDIGDKRINFTMWDTSGGSPYDNIRHLAYQDTRVFLLCFNIGQPESLENIIKKWHPEVRKHCPDVPVILCGCQNDSRTDSEIISVLAKQRKLPVTCEQANSAGKSLGVTYYMETSSKISPKSVKDAFEVAVLMAAGRWQKNSSTNGVNGVQRSRSFAKVRFKSKVQIKSDIRDKARTWNCNIM